LKQVTAFETVAPLVSYPPEIVLGEHKQGFPGVVVVYEHAASAIPSVFSDLGLDYAARASHIAWDPGAIGVAREVRRLLKGDLVAGTVSRLIYDCNRPPEAESAVPESSEAFLIPGNQKLSELDRRNRWQAAYKPLHEALSEILGSRSMGVVLTIHSFTPIYHGAQRSCEFGIVHDFADARLADAILAAVHDGFPFKVERRSRQRPLGRSSGSRPNSAARIRPLYATMPISMSPSRRPSTARSSIRVNPAAASRGSTFTKACTMPSWRRRSPS